MANKKISALDAATALNLTDVIPIIQGGVNKKITAANFKGEWQTITGAETYNAKNGNGYFFDSTSNAVTLKLPAPSIGGIVYFITKNITNTTTVARNGSEKIEGNAGNLILDALTANALVSDGTDWYLANK